jgi:hypothetical protein
METLSLPGKRLRYSQADEPIAGENRTGSDHAMRIRTRRGKRPCPNILRPRHKVRPPTMANAQQVADCRVADCRVADCRVADCRVADCRVADRLAHFADLAQHPRTEYFSSKSARRRFMLSHIHSPSPWQHLLPNVPQGRSTPRWRNGQDFAKVIKVGAPSIQRWGMASPRRPFCLCLRWTLSFFSVWR